MRHFKLHRLRVSKKRTTVFAGELLINVVFTDLIKIITIEITGKKCTMSLSFLAVLR